MKISSGKVIRPQKVVIYGSEGMLMMIAAQYIPSATATGLSGLRLIKKRIVPWTSW